MPLHLPSSSGIPFLWPADVQREARAASDRHEAIEKQLMEDSLAAKNEMRLLVLGSTESGKAEFMRCMKSVHQGVAQDERSVDKKTILTHTIESMRAALTTLPLLNLTLQPSNESYRDLILARGYEDQGHLAEDVAAAMIQLWKDPAIRTAVCNRSSECPIPSSSRYFFEVMERIFSSNYIPSNEDILKSQIKKTGIAETVFKVGHAVYRIIDPSNQRSDRRKWLPSFEQVTAILFIVDISEYDEMLYEDEDVNRLQDSLTFFDSICNSRWFADTSIILMLAKIDVLAQKLPDAPLSRYFPDYTGGNNCDVACDYILHRFVSLNQFPEKKHIYAHYTCMTDIQQFKFVLSAVQDMLLQIHLRQRKLL